MYYHFQVLFFLEAIGTANSRELDSDLCLQT